MFLAKKQRLASSSSKSHVISYLAVAYLKSVLNCEIIFPSFLSVHTASHFELLLLWQVGLSVDIGNIRWDFITKKHLLPLKQTCCCAEAAISIICDRLLAMTGLLPAQLNIVGLQSHFEKCPLLTTAIQYCHLLVCSRGSLIVSPHHLS